jgi:dephospho-CoA kinase
MQRFTVIGVAGGIGSGKSAVARALGRLGAPIFDADASARRILDQPDIASRIAARWGTGLLGPDGRVDRAGLATIVFRDDRARTELEELIHPIVRIEAQAAIDAARAAGARAIVLDIPLLYESGMDAMCDIVVFVDADEAVRLARVSRSRGWTARDLALREAAQWPLDAKRRRSGVVIVNNGSEESDLEAEAARAYSVACPDTGV